MVLGLFALIPQPAAAKPKTRVHPALLDQAGKQPENTFRVIVQRYKNDKKADDYVTKTKGGKKLNDIAADAFVVEVKGKHLDDIGKKGEVKYVSPDVPMIQMTIPGVVSSANLANLYPQTVNAIGLWSNSITGANVGVAVLDTGVAAANDDFGGRVTAQVNFRTGSPSTEDGNGHGTHVAGIVAGNSWQSADPAVKGKYVGIAPQANIINVKVGGADGSAYVSDTVNAIEWVIQNRVAYNIRVMNISMIQSIQESYMVSVLDAAVERAWFNGILVVVASGNGGPNTMKYPPANDPFVVTVGATDQMNTATPMDDMLAPWSSFGTTQDGISKPDLVAPGRYMTSVLAGNNTYLARYFTNRVTGDYLWLSGTSMAAPVVSGVAALAFQMHPEWTNDQVKWLLMQTATRLPAALLGQGAGEVNAGATVLYAGTPQGANQGLMISEQLIGPNGALIYNNSSWTSSSWTSSSWSSSSWTSSSWTSSSWTSSSWTSSSWTSSSWTTSVWDANGNE
jgi:serine protease AprX